MTSKIFNMKPFRGISFCLFSSFCLCHFNWFTQQLKKWEQTKRRISSTIKLSGNMFKALSKDTVFPTPITTFSFSMVKFIVGEKIRQEKVWTRKKNSSVNDYLSNCFLDIFFSIWVFFYKHSRFTTQQGKGGAYFFNHTVDCIQHCTINGVTLFAHWFVIVGC